MQIFTHLCVSELTKKQVSFHARLTSGTHVPTSGSHVILPTVVNNQGNAYNPVSGVFTAPFNGSYCFIFSTLATESNANANAYLMVDDREVAYVDAYKGSYEWEAGGNQAVVTLVAGQTVWLKSNSNSYYAPSTTFSGFLIGADF